MDSKKILAKYLKPKSVLLIIGVILLAAALVMVPVAIIAANNSESEAGQPTPFHALSSKDGEYVYLDVVGISSWVYRVDSVIYYTAMDDEGYFYTVHMHESDFEKMDAQHEYWLDENPNAIMPAPYRLTGIAKEATKEVRKNMSEAWQVTETEFEEYFGTMILDATTDPAEEGSAMWVVGIILSALFGIMFICLYVPGNNVFNRCVKVLEEKNLLDQAAMELEAEDTVKIGKDRGRRSRRFLYGKGTGFVALYSDLQWIYRREVKRYGITMNNCLMAATNDMGEKIAVNFGGRDPDGELMQVFMAISEINPNTLIGFTRENRKEYKERKKEAKIG